MTSNEARRTKWWHVVVAFAVSIAAAASSVAQVDAWFRSSPSSPSQNAGFLNAALNDPGVRAVVYVVVAFLGAALASYVLPSVLARQRQSRRLLKLGRLTAPDVVSAVGEDRERLRSALRQAVVREGSLENMLSALARQLEARLADILRDSHRLIDEVTAHKHRLTWVLQESDRQAGPAVVELKGIGLVP